MTLLPAKSMLFWAKQLIAVVIIALRFVECLADTASEWAGHYELALLFKGGSWVVCLIVLTAERRAGRHEHHWSLIIFAGIATLVPSCALRMQVMLNNEGFSSDTRQTAYVIALILSLGFAICISYVKEAEINKKKCGDDREQYSTIVPMNDQQQQYKSIDGDDEDDCVKEESIVDKLTPEIWKLNRVAEETAEEKRKWYSDVDTGLVIRILYFGRPEMWKLIIATTLTIVATILGMMKNLVFGFLVNEILESSDQSEAKSLLHKYVLFLVCCEVIEMVIGGAGSALLTVCGERIAVRLRNVTYSTILSQDIGFFDVNSTGELINRITTDTTVVTGVILSNMTTWIVPILNGVIGYIAIFLISYKMTLVMLSFTPAMLAGMYVMGKISQLLTQKDLDALAKANATSVEGVDHARTIKAHGTEQFEVHRYETDLNVSYDICILKAWISGFMGSLFGLISNAMSLVAMWYGATLVIEGKLLLGYLLTFQMFCGQALGATSAIMGIFPNFASAVAASKRIFQLLDRDRDVRLMGGKRVISLDPRTQLPQKVKGRVELKNVQFAYPARPHVKVLNDVSLVIEAGTMNALVGKSGSGKSTIMNLIANFYSLTGGSISFDHIEASSFDPMLYRRLIGYVSQTPVLFSTTVKENVAYGIHANDSQIEAACRQANAFDFITTKLDKGFDTECGPLGCTLSGGQKQRIAIARAILRNPCLLLLDEATSALDSESEFLVQEALDVLMKDRTSVVIAHRLTTIMKANQIHVMQDGKLMESGTHKSLMADPDSLYLALASRQFGLDIGQAQPTDAKTITKEASEEFGQAFNMISQLVAGAAPEIKKIVETLGTQFDTVAALHKEAEDDLSELGAAAEAVAGFGCEKCGEMFVEMDDAVAHENACDGLGFKQDAPPI